MASSSSNNIICSDSTSAIGASGLTGANNTWTISSGNITANTHAELPTTIINGDIRIKGNVIIEGAVEVMGNKQKHDSSQKLKTKTEGVFSTTFENYHCLAGVRVETEGGPECVKITWPKTDKTNFEKSWGPFYQTKILTCRENGKTYKNYVFSQNKDPVRVIVSTNPTTEPAMFWEWKGKFLSQEEFSKKRAEYSTRGLNQSLNDVDFFTSDFEVPTPEDLEQSILAAEFAYGSAVSRTEQLSESVKVTLYGNTVLWETRNGFSHREDGPATIAMGMNNSLFPGYCLDGQLIPKTVFDNISLFLRGDMSVPSNFTGCAYSSGGCLRWYRNGEMKNSLCWEDPRNRSNITAITSSITENHKPVIILSMSRSQSNNIVEEIRNLDDGTLISAKLFVNGNKTQIVCGTRINGTDRFKFRTVYSKPGVGPWTVNYKWFLDLLYECLNATNAEDGLKTLYSGLDSLNILPSKKAKAVTTTATKVGLRVVSRKLVYGLTQVIVGLLNGCNVAVTDSTKEVLSSKEGKAFLGLLLGAVANTNTELFDPCYKAKIEAVASELRVEGFSVVGESLVDLLLDETLFKPIFDQLKLELNSASSNNPTGVRVVNEQPNNTPATMLAELAELAHNKGQQSNQTDRYE